jgi:hypothetical protein
VKTDCLTERDFRLKGTHVLPTRVIESEFS